MLSAFWTPSGSLSTSCWEASPKDLPNCRHCQHPMCLTHTSSHSEASFLYALLRVRLGRRLGNMLKKQARGSTNLSFSTDFIKARSYQLPEHGK